MFKFFNVGYQKEIAIIKENLQKAIEQIESDKRYIENEHRTIADLKTKIHQMELDRKEMLSSHKIELMELKSQMDKESISISDYNKLQSQVVSLEYERDMFKKMSDTLQELPQLSKMYEAIAKLKLPSFEDIQKTAESLKNLSEVSLSETSQNDLLKRIEYSVFRAVSNSNKSPLY